MNERLHNQGENIVYELQTAVHRGAEIVGGLGADPLEVFPNPAEKERRADVVWGDNLTEEQQIAFRGIMAEIGPGREHDKGLDVSRLNREGNLRNNPELNTAHWEQFYNWKALLEGGQYHKVRAELELVLAQDIKPGLILPSASSGRILREEEKGKAAGLMGVSVEDVGDTEFDMVKNLFRYHPDFKPLEEEVVSPVRYDLAGSKGDYGIKPSSPNEERGQFVSIGHIKGIPVTMIRIDRFPHPEFPDDPKKFVQPSNSHKISYAAAMRAYLEYDTNVALVTSATYEPSCEVAALTAIKEYGIRMGAQVMSYGVVTLARIKHEDPAPPSIAQLGAEAYKVAKLLRETHL